MADPETRLVSTKLSQMAQIEPLLGMPENDADSQIIERKPMGQDVFASGVLSVVRRPEMPTKDAFYEV